MILKRLVISYNVFLNKYFFSFGKYLKRTLVELKKLLAQKKINC